MNHHCFVSALDVAEQLPFSFVTEKDLRKGLELKKKATDELEKFILALRTNMGEQIYHLGKDTINKRSLHRFMFEGPGFMEILLDAPVAINGHFQSRKRAQTFLAALKKTIRGIIPSGPRLEMFLSSIEIEDEHHVPLQIESLEKIHDLREILQRSATFVIVSLFLFTIMGAINEFFEYIVTDFLNNTYNFGVHRMVIVITIAVVLAFVFEPVKGVANRIVEGAFYEK